MSDLQLSIHTSNRLDLLVDELADTIARQPLGPLSQEILVVQSQGMRRWLTLELARRHGIAAGLRMPFPQSFCYELADELLDDDGHKLRPLAARDESDFGREILTWRVFADMAAWPGNPTFAPPAAYLRDDLDQLRRYQLARRIADLFDNYQLYRPDMLLAWERDGEPAAQTHSAHETWQATLWRRLVADSQEEHLAHRFRRLIELLATGRPAHALPERISVFGVATLAPVFVDLLAALSRHVPVRVYFVSPTYHYWADLRSPRELVRVQKRLQAAGKALDEAHFEQGNALLASLGRQGREFFNLLQRADPDGSAWQTLDFIDPCPQQAAGNAAAGALQILQSDVLHLRRRGPGADRLAVELQRGDRSLTVAACHSPMREMEVLRDQILAAFDEIEGLRPHDVLVLVTDIERYAPYIETVFGAAGAGRLSAGAGDPPYLPYSVADRPATAEYPPVRAVLELLDLVTSRVTAARVLDFLGLDIIRRRFEIGVDDLATIGRWVEQTAIRWGIDAEHRRQDLGLPAFEANSWKAGLDRLLMGYAVGDSDELVCGLAPWSEAAAADPGLVGRFAGFLDALFESLRALRAPRALSRWSADLHGALDRMVAETADAEEHATALVRRTLSALAAGAERAGLDEPVSIQVVRSWLARALSEDVRGHGFIAGRVTFCELKPMRTIPFRVICIAGLGEDRFPRRDRAAGFDLMAGDESRRDGDRSLAGDDRYLFLETLLSARDRLVLTYEGRSQRDNTAKAPALVIAELLAEIDRTFVTTDGVPASTRVCVEHRLQPFDGAYFGGGTDQRLFSYSSENAALATQGLAAAECERRDGLVAPQAAGFADLEIATITDTPQTVSLDDLTRFWSNPPRFFARDVLGIRIDDGSRAISESEPFALDALAAYPLGQQLLDRRVRGRRDPERELERLAAGGHIPLASLAAPTYDALDQQVQRVAHRIPPFRPAPALQLELAGEGWLLVGSIEGMTDIGLLRFRCARRKPKDVIRAWIAHVAATAHARTTTAKAAPTRIISTDGDVAFAPPDDPLSILDDLVAGYLEGRRRALPFFEQASFEYATRRFSPKRTEPMVAARQRYLGNERARGDVDDAYVALCFRDLDPLREHEAEFRARAERFWKPAFDHAKGLS